jgi:hypothetical protein
MSSSPPHGKYEDLCDWGWKWHGPHPMIFVPSSSPSPLPTHFGVPRTFSSLPEGLKFGYSPFLTHLIEHLLSVHIEYNRLLFPNFAISSEAEVKKISSTIYRIRSVKRECIKILWKNSLQLKE